jgi:ubiquinone/menaquinone biosynthesis C-methylase UbiE
MESAARAQTAIALANEEATEAWSGVLFDVYVEYRDLIVGGPLQHAEVAMRAHPPRSGDSVLDVGCGFGDTTRQLAALVGADGSALGVDVAEPFIEAAIAEAQVAGTENVEFQSGDVQVMSLPGPFDYVYSQIGMMFFANPVQAMRNLLSAMSPGGRLCAVVWRQKLDNDWLHRAEQVVDKYLDEPEETDVATCGPGPFSMANADTVSEQLGSAGFEEISFRRCDVSIKIGDDLDHAIRFNMAIGPAAELIRLNPERSDELRPVLAEELREALSEFQGPDGVWAPASTWIIGATAPAAA